LRAQAAHLQTIEASLQRLFAHEAPAVI